MKNTILLAFVGIFLLPLPAPAQTNPFRLGFEIAKQRKVLRPEMGSEFFRNLNNAVIEIEGGATVEAASQRNRVKPSWLYRLLEYSRQSPIPQTLTIPTVEAKSTPEVARHHKKLARKQIKTIKSASMLKTAAATKPMHKDDSVLPVAPSPVAHSSLPIDLKKEEQEKVSLSNELFMTPERFIKSKKVRFAGFEQHQMIYLHVTGEPEVVMFERFANVEEKF